MSNNENKEVVHFCKVLAGEHIDDAIKKAIGISLANRGEKVTFNFNGVDLVVDQSSTLDGVKKEFNDTLKKRSEEYKKTPEYEAEQGRYARYASENKRDQLIIDNLVASLPQVAGGGSISAIVKWVGDFAHVNDNINLKYDKKQIADILKSAVETNPKIFAGWLVGQAIQNLESGMPIHSILTKFAEDFQTKFGEGEEPIPAVIQQGVEKSVGGKGRPAGS